MSERSSTEAASLTPNLRSSLTGAAAVALLYACFAKVVLVLFATNGVVSLVWPPSGVALAALLLGGGRLVPGVFVGALTANLWAGNPLSVSVAISVGNTLEAVVAWRMLSARAGFSVDFDRLAHFRQLLLAAGLGSLVAACGGAATLLASGFLSADRFWFNLLQWWQGDMLGMLLMTPALLVWRRPPWREWFGGGGWRVVEFCAFLGSMVIVGQIVFLGWWHEIFGPIAQSYWVLLFVVWAAVRFGRHGVVLMLVVAGAQSLAGVSLGVGYFAGDLALTGLENVWFSFALATLTGLSLGLLTSERDRVEDALRQAAELSDGIVQSLPGLFYMLDERGCLIRSNQRLAEETGYSAEQVVGLPALETVAPEDRALAGERIRQSFTDGEANVEARILRRDGKTTPYSFHGRRCVLGGETRLVGLAYDITERKRMEDALRANEQLLQFALEGAGDAVWDWDVAGRRITHNSRWNTLLGYAADDSDDVVGDWASHTHPEDLPIARANHAALLDGKTDATSIELRLRCKDGSWKWFLSRGMVVSRDEAGRPLRIVGTNADITLLKEHQHQLERIAHYDALTGMPNRMLLGARLQQAMADSQRRATAVAVAYLDLDGFKAVNDRHGHDVGDALLVIVAQRIKAALRECDTLARIGGDEFVAVMADLERPDACEPLLMRLLAAAAAPATIGGVEMQVSASIGVTLYPRDGSDADQLMRHADQAMYQAKQTGRNRYHVFDVEQDAAVRIQRESVEHIRRALAQREFVLFYQPKVQMRSGMLVGVEALIRWQHPEHGILPPAAFLPLIEEPSISVALGEWVIETALAQIDVWREAGLQISVSVNIGAQHLQQEHFVTRLSELLAAHPHIAPGSLELEILETSALEDVVRVSEVMRACQAMGVTFALDDFGTGYSSLTYLRRLPAEALKIDRTFVRDMLEDPDDMAIVEGVVGLGNAFHRALIAEGVETVAHGEALLRLGCEVAQGYAIARPMPAAELAVWVRDWRPDVRWTGSAHV